MEKNTVGGRLRNERARIGLTQEVFGAHGGVKKLTQIKYEKDESSPTAAYLEAVATLGVDVRYVVLGVRNTLVLESISDRAKNLITNFEQMGEGDKQAIEHLVSALPKPQANDGN